MADYSLMITDNPGDDTWTFEVRKAPTTVPAGGTVLSDGATTLGGIHDAFTKAQMAIKNNIVDAGSL